MDFSKVTDIVIPEGNVTKITDTNNTRTIWTKEVTNTYTLKGANMRTFVRMMTMGNKDFYYYKPNNEADINNIKARIEKYSSVKATTTAMNVTATLTNPTVGTCYYAWGLEFLDASGNRGSGINIYGRASAFDITSTDQKTASMTLATLTTGTGTISDKNYYVPAIYIEITTEYTGMVDVKGVVDQIYNNIILSFS